MIAKRVRFEGRVQGVGFRYTAKDLAKGFEVCGWVRNLPDGSVEMQVMGEDAEVMDYIREIAVESPLVAGIRNHYVESIPLMEDCKGFAIVK